MPSFAGFQKMLEIADSRVLVADDMIVDGEHAAVIFRWPKIWEISELGIFDVFSFSNQNS